MRIRHISFSSQGGAGKAAQRLSSLQRRFGLDSEHIHLTDSDLRNRPFQHSITTLMAGLDSYLVQKKEARPLQFSALRSSVDSRFPEHIAAEVFHLHWPAGVWGPRSFELARSRGVAVIQTLHDDFPFTGGCHNAGSCIKYETGCTKCPLVKPMFWGLASSIQAAKSNSLASERPVITAQSNWMLERALKSVVLKNARTHKIPNVISEAFFIERLALQSVEASFESPLRIGFIAANVEDPNKGFDAAIQTLQACGLSFVFRVVGASSRKINTSSGQIHFLGPLTSSQLVDECESWDFLFVNSLQENSPTVISEMACIGVPTLSVEVGAIPEMISGYGLGMTVRKNYTPLEFKDSALRLRSMATPHNKTDLSARARLLHSPRALHEDYLRAYASEG